MIKKFLKRLWHVAHSRCGCGGSYVEGRQTPYGNHYYCENCLIARCYALGDAPRIYKVVR